MMNRNCLTTDRQPEAVRATRSAGRHGLWGCTVAVALLAVAFDALPAPAVEFEALTADDRKQVGTIASFDSETLKLQTKDGEVSVPTAELMALTQLKPDKMYDGAPKGWIDLMDGSSIAAFQWTLDGDTAHVTLLDGQTMECPRQALASIRFQPAVDPIAGQWTGLVQKKHNGDIVVVRKEDHLDFLLGIVRGVTADSVAFEMDGEVLPIRRTKLFGIILLRPAGIELPDAIGRLTDAYGSQWSVRSFSLAKQFEWSTPAAVAMQRSPEAILKIDFTAGKVLYLADIEPQSIDWTPFFPMDTELPSRRTFFQPRRNRGFDSDVLTLGGAEFGRGLVLHSRTEVVYHLPNEASRLRATAGIDDRVRPQGSVVLVIRGDGKPLYEATLTGTDPPAELDLDVAGIRRLSILCDFGEMMDVGDQLNLCNLRVVK